MAYVIKIVGTKPANVAWFKDSSPTEIGRAHV